MQYKNDCLPSVRRQFAKADRAIDYCELADKYGSYDDDIVVSIGDDRLTLGEVRAKAKRQSIEHC